MPYCPECGSEIGQRDDAAPGPTEAEVRIAEINAERDIKIAQLQNRQQREANETTEHVAETAAEADVDVAEAHAEAVTAAAEAEPDGDEPAAAEPIVVEQAEPEPEQEPEMAPPEADHHHHEPETKKSAGWWDAYH